MSNSKSYKRYSGAWLELFDAFKDNPEQEIVVDCPDPRSALTLRLEFYKAREAFLGDPEMDAEYGEALNSRELRVRGSSLVFASKDRNWVAKAIADALHK